jgi:hypothetical protein
MRLDGPDVALVPDVLGAWVRFAARDRGLPEPAVARILDVIARCRDDFQRAMDAAAHLGAPEWRKFETSVRR